MGARSRRASTTARSEVSPQDNAALISWAANCYYDPLAFVLSCYPWGEPGTDLASEDGPDKWQLQVLEELRDALMAGAGDEAIGETIRLAVASGHGVGKTALVAWIIHWFCSTRANPQVVVTANTQNQLQTKTWRELAKWWKLAINGHWFLWTATRYIMLSEPTTWFASAIPWSEHNSEAFAGTHEKHVLIVFDEASAIADIIWEVVEGATTTPGAIWIAFGNPTKNTGRFRQCWTKFRRRWRTFEVDARTAKKANQAQIAEWIEDHGIDSDFVRVRVLGQFPKVGPKQFIGNHLVDGAIARKIEPQYIPASTPKLMGVDVARGGACQSVIVKRHGRKMLEDIKRYRINDLMQLASFIALEIKQWKPDIVFIDATGMGIGVYDRLVQMGFGNVIAVFTGSHTVNNPEVYRNVRIEAWARMKAWLEQADLPDDRELAEDLIGPEFYFNERNQMLLEKKEDMMKRGLASPDTGDALALTFAVPSPQQMTQENYGVEPDVT